MALDVVLALSPSEAMARDTDLGTRIADTYGMAEFARSVDSAIVEAGGHADGTEVLTPTSWKRLAEITPQDRVAQYDPRSGVVTFVEPLAVTHRAHQGELVAIRARWCDLLVAPDHPVAAGTGSGALHVRAAETLRAGMRMPVAGHSPGRDGPTPDQARVITAWLADGSWREVGQQVYWHLKKARKIARLAELLDAVGVAYRTKTFPSSQGWRSRWVRKPDLGFVWDAAPRKCWEWGTLGWSVPAREAVLEELRYWDGDAPGPHSVRLFTGRAQDADVIAALAAVTGRGCIVRADTRADRPRQQTQYVVSLVDRAQRHLGRAPSPLTYSGTVSRVHVPSGLVVTRRNGRTTIA